MKKTLLSAAAFAVVAVSAVSIAPTTSEAIPAFARQTGAACLSCHFQTFPALNSFGRAFKMGAFTDVGEQALIEDDNLSLPAVLNSAFVLRGHYQSDKKTTAAGVTSTTTTWAIPADTVLLMAGRVGSNTGAFVEFAGAGAGATGAANWQLMNSFDFDTFKGGLNIQNTGFGPTAAIEVSNVFGQHAGKLNGAALSSIQNILVNYGNTTSVAAWAGNESFLVQATGVAFADAAGVTNASFVPMIRGTYIADLGAAELMIGGGILSGTQRAAGVLASGQGADAKFIDAQVQGEMGDMSYGIYADWTTTKAKRGSNLFVAGTNSKIGGYSFRAEVSPIHKVMLGAGIGQVKTTTAGVATKRQLTQVSATYEIYQNMEFNMHYLIDNDKTLGTKTKTTYAEVLALF